MRECHECDQRDGGLTVKSGINHGTFLHIAHEEVGHALAADD